MSSHSGSSGGGRYAFENNPACERVLRMFSLCSNEYRFKILCILAEGECCVHDIVNALDARYSNISQQLKMLTLAGYLDKERRRRQTFYRLKSQEIRDVLDFLKATYADDANQTR
jgi:ArsR family transcriptional regulator